MYGMQPAEMRGRDELKWRSSPKTAAGANTKDEHLPMPMQTPPWQREVFVPGPAEVQTTPLERSGKVPEQ